MRVRHTLWITLMALLVAACGGGGAGIAGTSTAPPATTPSTTTTSMTSTTTPAGTPAPKQPTTTAPALRKSATVKPSPKPKARPRPVGLVGDTRNAMAFAPLANPGAVVVEGSVPSYRAWSTSKVLVVAAFLDTVVDGDPSRLTSEQRTQITRALTESHMESVIALRDQIPGSPGAAITAVLRSVGDTSTVAPDRSQGSMQWTIRQQVRFMAALHGGRVVSQAASAHILQAMRPIPEHRWGLGTIGAGPFKGGWLRSDTETRQMGIVNGYAVAIITAGVGPAVVQTDGDAAHVRQMNYLASVLKRRLAAQ